MIIVVMLIVITSISITIIITTRQTAAPSQGVLTVSPVPEAAKRHEVFVGVL